MPEADPFGSRYYGREESQAARRPGKRPDTHEEAKLRKLLDEDVPDRVKRTVKQWNQTVREFIRTKTALRLTVAEAGHAVPIKVVDGLPLPFAEILQSVDENLLWLTLNRPTLEATAAGLRQVIRRFSDFQKWPPIKQSRGQQEGCVWSWKTGPVKGVLARENGTTAMYCPRFSGHKSSNLPSEVRRVPAVLT